MRWRTLALEVVPAMLLVAGLVLLDQVMQAQGHRSAQVVISPDGEYMRSIYAQPFDDPVAILRAAQALHAAGYPSSARNVLHAAERLMLWRAVKAPAPYIRSVGEAAQFAESESDRRRQRYFPLQQIVGVVVAPAVIPGEFKTAAGRDALHVSGAMWKDPDSGALRVAVELQNLSASPILDVEMEINLKRSLAERNAYLHCRTPDDRGDQPATALAAGEARRMLCSPVPEASPGDWARVVEGLERWRYGGIIQRIKFAELPVWIDGYSGAQIPDEWPARDAFLPGKAPAVDLAGNALDCTARGMCKDEAVLQAWGLVERSPLLATFVASLVVGLCMGALARRLFARPVAFRRVAAALNALAVLAAIGFIAGVAMMGGYAIYLAIMLIPLAGLALVSWFAGFWINTAMLARAPAASDAAAPENPAGA